MTSDDRISARKRRSLARAIGVAAEMFAVRGYQNVSITDIAVAAHCSTATIYEAAGTKQDFFLKALNWAHDAWRSPSVAPLSAGMSALEAIVDFGVRRVTYLCDPHSRNLTALTLVAADRAREGLKKLFRERDQAIGLEQLVRMAMNEGTLRVTSTRSAVHCILSAMSFEPILMNLYFRRRVDILALLRTVLDPLLTVGGREELEPLLQRYDRNAALAGDTTRQEFGGLVTDRGMLILGAHAED